MAEYNPFSDFNPVFTRYQNVQPKKVELRDSFDNITDISDWASNVLPNGNIVVSPNTPEAAKAFDTSFLDKNAETHSEDFIENSSVKQDLTGSEKKAMEFFKSKKDSNGKQILTDYQIAGIVGNLMGESKLNAKAVNPTSGAFGYAQWLGDRKKKLFAKYGNNPTEEQQLEFIWEELNTSERRAFEELLQTRTVDGAINSFMRHFERPSQKEMAQSIRNRLKYGRELLS